MWVEILIILGLLCLWFYHYCTKQFDEFKKRGIPFAKPSFPFGSRNAKKLFMGEISFFGAEKLLAEDEEFKNEKVFGYFMMGQPNLVINDEDLAKKVLIKDFDHFTDLRQSGYEANTKDAQIMKYMGAMLKGEKWKKVRSILSGAFSSGKLKGMHPHIVKVGEHLEEHITQFVEKSEEFEVRDIASTFTLDSMATSGYGLEINSFENPDNTFQQMALALVGAPGYGSSMDMVRQVCLMVAPSIAKLLGLPHFPKKPTLFLSDIIEKTYRQRMESGNKRNDIIDLLVEEMKSSGLSKEFKEEEKEMLLVAQAFMMFMVGYDSIGVGVSIIAHKLLKFPEVQDKLLAEIDSILEETGGEVTYEAVQEMKYMDRVISECGRYQNLQTSHERMCTKDYFIPEMNITIPKGRMVKVYFTPFENSEKNFKNPHQFDPDNFLPENKFNKFAYMNFGQGPRACPAQRYAYLVQKICLVHMLRNNRLVASERTNMGDLELDPHGIFAIKGGVWCKIEKRN